MFPSAVNRRQKLFGHSTTNLLKMTLKLRYFRAVGRQTRQNENWCAANRLLSLWESLPDPQETFSEILAFGSLNTFLGFTANQNWFQITDEDYRTIFLLKGATWKHAGLYTLTATNVNGTDKHTVEIIVLGRPSAPEGNSKQSPRKFLFLFSVVFSFGLEVSGFL